MARKSGVLVEVSFDVNFDPEDMPDTYTDPGYLEEVITEAIQDAMYDVGAQQVEKINVGIEGLE
jgi:DNA-binding protein YbaB